MSTQLIPRGQQPGNTVRNGASDDDLAESLKLLQTICPQVILPQIESREFHGFFKSLRRNRFQKEQQEKIQSSANLERARLIEITNLLDLSNDAKRKVIEQIDLKFEATLLQERYRLKCLELKSAQEAEQAKISEHKLTQARNEQAIANLYLPPPAPVPTPSLADQEREESCRRLNRLIGKVETLADLNDKWEACLKMYPHLREDVDALFEEQRQRIILQSGSGQEGEFIP